MTRSPFQKLAVFWFISFAVLAILPLGMQVVTKLVH